MDGFSICGGNYYGVYPDNTITVNEKEVYNKSGGGIYATYSAVCLKNLEIRRNAAPGAGAGIYCDNSSDLREYNLYPFKNFGSTGGGICVTRCNPKFKNIIVLENEAGMGVGIATVGWSETPTAPHFINANLGTECGTDVHSEGVSPVLTKYYHCRKLS